jgi:quercetin dioxygenase-like cupin family protein
MNIKELHAKEKGVSAQQIFKGKLASATGIQLQEDAVLKEHATKTAALLLCISGNVLYEDETGEKIELVSGDYVNIIPNVIHWIKANSLSQLILLK